MFILLFFLILLLPTQLAKHFWFSFSFVHGLRLDYLAPTLYLTDLLVFLLFLLFLWLKKPCSFFKKLLPSPLFLFGLLLVVLNTLLSSRPPLALYGWLRFFELAGLFLLLRSLSPSFSFLFLPLFLSLLLTTSLGLAQFIRQSSLNGLFYWLGERHFNLTTPGIARTSFFGRQLLRSYSLFPHPNAFAGYSLLATLLLVRPIFLSPRPLLLKLLSFLLLPLVLFITFSRTAWFALLFLSLFFLVLRLLSQPRRQQLFALAVFVSLLLFSFLTPLFLTLLPPTSSVLRRLWLLQASLQLIHRHPILGVGLLNFIPSAAALLSSPPSALLQPPHNILFLLASETGLVGLSLFVFFLYRSFTRLVNQQRWSLAAALLTVLFTGAFDHYWLTLRQNQLLLTLLFALIWQKKEIH